MTCVYMPSTPLIYYGFFGSQSRRVSIDLHGWKSRKVCWVTRDSFFVQPTHMPRPSFGILVIYPLDMCSSEAPPSPLAFEYPQAEKCQISSWKVPTNLLKELPQFHWMFLLNSLFGQQSLDTSHCFCVGPSDDNGWCPGNWWNGTNLRYSNLTMLNPRFLSLPLPCCNKPKKNCLLYLLPSLGMSSSWPSRRAPIPIPFFFGATTDIFSTWDYPPP